MVGTGSLARLAWGCRHTYTRTAVQRLRHLGRRRLQQPLAAAAPHPCRVPPVAFYSTAGGGTGAADPQEAEAAELSLQEAAWLGSPQIGVLLERGADVDATDKHGGVAIVYAAWKGHTSTTAALIDHGANTEVAFGEAAATPLVMAAMNGHTETVALLQESGANTEARDSRGYTALLCAVLEGHSDTAALLLERGAGVDAGDTDGWTPLMHASHKGQLDTATMLMERGADTEATNSSGRTAVMEAVNSGELSECLSPAGGAAAASAWPALPLVVPHRVKSESPTDILAPPGLCRRRRRGRHGHAAGV